MDDIAEEFDSRRAPASGLTEKTSVQTNKVCIALSGQFISSMHDSGADRNPLEVEGSTFAMTSGWGQMPLWAKEFLGYALQ